MPKAYIDTHQIFPKTQKTTLQSHEGKAYDPQDQSNKTKGKPVTGTHC